MERVYFPNPDQKLPIGGVKYYKVETLDDFKDNIDSVKLGKTITSVLIEGNYGLSTDLVNPNEINLPELFNSSFVEALAHNSDSDGMLEVLLAKFQKYPYGDENQVFGFLVDGGLVKAGKLQCVETHNKISISSFCLAMVSNHPEIPILYSINSSGARKEGNKDLFEKFKEGWKGLKPGLRPVWENF